MGAKSSVVTFKSLNKHADTLGNFLKLLPFKAQYKKKIILAFIKF